MGASCRCQRPSGDRRHRKAGGRGDQGYGDDDDDAYARADTALNEAVQVYDSTQELISERLRTLVSGRRRGNQQPVRRVGAATFPNPSYSSPRSRSSKRRGVASAANRARRDRSSPGLLTGARATGRPPSPPQVTPRSTDAAARRAHLVAHVFDKCCVGRAAGRPPQPIALREPVPRPASVHRRPRGALRHPQRAPGTPNTRLRREVAPGVRA